MTTESTSGFFATPEGLVVTTRQVMLEEWPILLVIHDGEDDLWQFVNGHGDTDDESDGMLVHPSHILDSDPSVRDLATLPGGWRAWRRDRENPWVREPDPEQPGSANP